MTRRYLIGVRSLTISYIKRFFRDKIALFFVFLFPLMFLLVFGALNRDEGGISFEVALINKSQSQFATEFVANSKESTSLKLNEEITDIEDAKERMGRGELDSIIELPETFGNPNTDGLPSGEMIVYYEEANPQTGKTLASALQGELDVINRKLTKVKDPFVVKTQSTATANLSSFDYVFSGLLGFSLLSLGIFGMANSFPAEKKTGALRRLRVAPIGASQLIFANGLSYLVSGLLSAATMVIAALVIFDFNMRGDYLSLSLFVIISIVMLFGFGLAIGGWAKNENQAAPLSNIVAFPMMFLSGVFFPRFLMPEWLQMVTDYLPLTPVVDGLREITAEGATILDLGPELAIMAGWILVIYFVAIRVFRWE